MNTKYLLILSLLLSLSTSASTENNFESFRQDGFTDTEIVSLFKNYSRVGDISQRELNALIYAAQNPFAPESSHAGNKFYEALSWYNDLTTGNRDGRFSLHELSQVFESETKKYLTMLFQESPSSSRIASWKMLQKLTLLKREIVSSGKRSYKYSAKKLGQINHNNEWNRKNTLKSRRDFERRVLQASWDKPVLIKFGLTYCVHCLLMENLGSVPAVARKYENELDVYKLWWNPNDNQNYGELNQVASEQGITSSPMFNLYINGRLVKSGYAFPDENGDGLEDFLSDFL